MSPTIVPQAGPARPPAGAWIDGFIGMAIFSGSLVATRLALTGFDALFVTAARDAIAGLAAGLVLALARPRLPKRGDGASLVVVALGVVVGFPLLSALALRHVGTAHATVFLGLLPLATASFAAMRSGDRPPRPFWLFSGLGSAIVIGFAARDLETLSPAGDGLMLLAVLVCGLGYAEGGRLARHLGGWPVIAWALVLSLPLSLPLTGLWLPPDLVAAPVAAWAGLAYVSLFSMLVGFVFWYRALALGGIAAIGQLQLLQPFLGLALAAAILGEVVEPAMGIAAFAVMACVAGARRFA